MDRLVFTGWQRRRLERQLREAGDVRLYRRTLAVREVARGKPVADVARTLGVTRQSVYNWADAYAAGHDPRSLADADRSGRPTVWSDDLRSALGDTLRRPPDRLGYPAVNWTIPLLQEHLERAADRRPGVGTIRRELHRLGYVWKRFRYVLDPDPEREKKTRHPPARPGSRAAARPARRG
jgi:transposase